MKHSIFKKLLRKYENGTATKAERYIVEQWYNSLQRDDIGTIPGIATEEAEKATRARILYKIIPQPAPKLWYRNTWLRIAASLILILSIAITFYLERQSIPQEKAGTQLSQLFSTGNKQVKKILLQDSTVVWLNANSSISLRPEFGKKSRHLKLTGEAFFEVSKDPGHPFLVETSSIKITVLGTSFNISAYKDLRHIKVIVNTGKIQVSDSTQKIALLTPGLGMRYDKATKQALISKFNPEQENSWTAGKIVLEKASFQELVQSFFNLYGLKLSSKDRKVRSLKYNITLKSTQTAEQALETITSILNKHHKKEGENGIMIY